MIVLLSSSEKLDLIFWSLSRYGRLFLCDKVKGSSGGQNEAMGQWHGVNSGPFITYLKAFSGSKDLIWQGVTLPHQTRRAICSKFLVRWKFCGRESEWGKCNCGVITSQHYTNITLTVSPLARSLRLATKLWIWISQPALTPRHAFLRLPAPHQYFLFILQLRAHIFCLKIAAWHAAGGGRADTDLCCMHPAETAACCC